MIPQHIEYQSPPAHEFVLSATVEVPSGTGGAFQVPGCLTDSRLFLSLPTVDVYEVNALVPAGTAAVDLAPGRSSGASRVARWLPMLADPRTLTLRIDGHDFPLTIASAVTGWHRLGRVMATAAFHRSLGQYGAAEYWITARADAPQFDVELLWNNAYPHDGVAFQRAELVSRAPWVPSIPDPSCAPPVLATADWIPQEMGRPFWFSIGLSHEPERVGVAGGTFWGLPVPNASAPPYDLAGARQHLATLAPTEPWQPRPVSAFWPADGDYSASGHTEQVWPLLGGRWKASHGDSGALEYLRIEQLRGQARASIRLGGSGGVFYDGWLSGSPWAGYWDPWLGARDPRRFQDYGIASYVQRLNESWALLLMANDPLSLCLAREGAARAMLTFPAPEPCQTPGLGTTWGAGQASAALAVALFGRSTWTDAWLAHVRAAQMPSGCIVARRGAYPSQHAPFVGGDYALQGSTEFALLQLAAYELGAPDIVRNAARGMVGLATDDDDPGLYYFTPTAGAAPYLDEDDWPADLHAAMGTAESYYTVEDVAYPIALACFLGCPESAELLRRYGPRTLTRPNDEQFEQFWPLLGVAP